MSDYISAELAATCAALGYYDGHKYHLDHHCLDVIKDLIKYLKRDDDTHTIRRFLGQTKLLQTDLINIFVEHADKTELWDVLLRLIINLTSPAHIIYNEEIPTEKTMRNLYEQIISYLQAYKVALADDRVWTVVSNRLAKILNIESYERGEENEMIIERILVLIRNVLQVPPSETESRANNDATVHDQVLFALHSSNSVDLLLFIASNSSEQQYHMQLLEIVSLMLREQSASQLAASGVQRSTAEKERDEAQLLAVRQKEMQEKMEKIRKYAGSRHSRFGGTYVVQNMKAIGDNQLICHKPFTKIESLDFSQQKKKAKKPKNKQAMQDSKDERTSALSVRLFLKEFCVEFLAAAYNPIMRHARSCIVAANHGEACEASCYLWALRFFMEFNRHYKFQVKYVSETISTEVFHLVQRQMEQCYEMMATDKKRIPLWSRRLHLALKAYQELLHTLLAMDKSGDQGVRESSKVIKSNVFYVPEYRETILSQLLCFDEVKMSRKYLTDLLATAHTFLKMLEHFCSTGRRGIVVRKAKQKRRKGKQRKKTAARDQPAVQRSLEERWDDVGPELSAVMQEGVIPEVVPFDATLDTPIDEQKCDAMKRIQRLLRQKHLEEALGLIRAAREVWPENDCFGRTDMPPEEEFLALREIFFADLGVVEDDPGAGGSTENSQTRAGEGRDEKDGEDEEELENEVEDEDEEEEDGGVAYEETDFKFSEFLHRFANVKIVKAVSILLRQFDTNSAEVNHYVAKMLHRIAFDCKMPAMIFQASIFRTFQRILDSKHPEHKELRKFAEFVVRRFAEVAQKNRKSYMELLFWKTTHNATDMVEGYDAETDNKKASRGVWTEAEEDELRTLFMEHQTNKHPHDLVDWILERLINESRTRRGVIKKLKEMCLVVNSKAVRSEVQKRLPKEWSEEELAELARLWEDFKDDQDPVDSVYNGLTIKRPKPKIKERLLESGLAKDPKELRKKRARKSNHGKSSWETQSVDDSDEAEASCDEETAKSTGRGVQGASKPARKGVAKRSVRKQPAVVYTDAQLSGLLKDVIDKGMSEALEWVKECLQDALEDRDEESTEGVPLVPFMEYAVTAMETPSFQKLLRAMNIAPPADEQEAYWRIPANTLAATIQKRCGIVADALSGKFVSEEPAAEASRKADSDGGGASDESEDDEDVLENVKKFFAPRDDSSKASGRTKVPYSSESEPEVGRSASTGNREDDEKRPRSENSDTERPSSKKRRLLDSDEDEEAEEEKEKEGTRPERSELKPTPMIVSSDEGTVEEPSRPIEFRTSRAIISDDDDDEELPGTSKPAKSKLRVLIDDDDDDE